MKDKIKNCPHCGAEATLVKRNHKEYCSTYEVKCKECGISTGSYMDKNIVIEKWNRRQPAYINEDFEAAVRDMIEQGGRDEQRREKEISKRI